MDTHSRGVIPRDISHLHTLTFSFFFLFFGPLHEILRFAVILGCTPPFDSPRLPLSEARYCLPILNVERSLGVEFGEDI